MHFLTRIQLFAEMLPRLWLTDFPLVREVFWIVGFFILLKKRNLMKVEISNRKDIFSFRDIELLSYVLSRNYGMHCRNSRLLFSGKATHFMLALWFVKGFVLYIYFLPSPIVFQHDITCHLCGTSGVRMAKLGGAIRGELGNAL